MRRILVLSVLLASAVPGYAAEHILILQDRESGYRGTRDTQLPKDYNLGGWTEFGIWPQ